jgi:hypothetical protein
MKYYSSNLYCRNRFKDVECIHLAQKKDPVAVSCKHSNELSGAVKGGQFICYICNHQVIKNKTANGVCH